MAGLLASRPEIVAHTDAGTEHVAEARAASAAWIATFSPAVAAPLVASLGRLPQQSRSNQRRSPSHAYCSTADPAV